MSRRLHKTYKNIIRFMAVAITAGGFLLGGTAPVWAAGTQTAGSQMPGFCVPFNAPVALGAGQPFNQRVAGTYCQPSKWMKNTPHQVDVLTAGATYNRNYWNWPQNPALYSYVQKTLAEGRATLAYDRIGSGQSSHPVSTAITMAGDAYVLHEIIQVLKIAGYSKINSIGHSYGSGIALHEAATYKDVSRVVLTGYLHVAGNPIVAAGNYPANLDPAFAGQNLDSGYLTTKPGQRPISFYSSTGDPSVIAYDEAHKDLVSATGFGGFFADRGVPAGSNLANQITVPVLLVDGQQDAIFCYNPALLDCTNTAGVTAHEAPYYTGAASFKVATIPNTGHDLTLHPSANTSFNVINQWIKNN